MHVRMAIEPANDDRQQFFRQKVVQAGAEVVPLQSANSLLWLTPEVASLRDILADHPAIEWVQFPWAGVEDVVAQGLLRPSVTFTCAKGLYAGQVAEHALFLALAGLRNAVEQARLLEWSEREPESLAGKRVTVLGGGGIAERLTQLLQPFGCPVTVLRRSSGAVDHAARTLTIDHLHAVLPDTDLLILALALTPATTGIIGAKELALLPPAAGLVNVARGKHVDTDALVAALSSGSLRWAGLDVTEPEPLPSHHPLWSMSNVMITSHSADSRSYCTEQLARRVVENIGRLHHGEPLVGQVDAAVGY
jgi:phosphoglycerate dehydrogenase-like enzyme